MVTHTSPTFAWWWPFGSRKIETIVLDAAGQCVMGACNLIPNSSHSTEPSLEKPNEVSFERKIVPSFADIEVYIFEKTKKIKDLNYKELKELDKIIRRVSKKLKNLPPGKEGKTLIGKEEFYVLRGAEHIFNHPANRDAFYEYALGWTLFHKLKKAKYFNKSGIHEEVFEDFKEARKKYVNEKFRLRRRTPQEPKPKDPLDPTLKLKSAIFNCGCIKIGPKACRPFYTFSIWQLRELLNSKMGSWAQTKRLVSTAPYALLEALGLRSPKDKYDGLKEYAVVYQVIGYLAAYDKSEAWKKTAAKSAVVGAAVVGTAVILGGSAANIAAAAAG